MHREARARLRDQPLALSEEQILAADDVDWLAYEQAVERRLSLDPAPEVPDATIGVIYAPRPSYARVISTLVGYLGIALVLHLVFLAERAEPALLVLAAGMMSLPFILNPQINSHRA